MSHESDFTNARGSEPADALDIVDRLGNRPILGQLAAIERIARPLREELLAPVGISRTEYVILARLRDRGAATAADLAREVHLTSQAIGQALVRLEQQGHVARGDDPEDARRSPVRITDAGLDVIQSGRRALVPIERVMLEGMTEREVLLFGVLLDVVVDNLERARSDRRTAED